jgi:DNA-binding MarR family transcriptional regulator
MLQSAVLAWLRLYRVVLKIDRTQNVHLRKYDLNSAQFDVLAQVGAHQGITQQELADHLLVTKGNISQLLNRMEQRGLISRCPDKRSNVLRLTEAGQELHDQVVPAHEDMIAAQLTMLSRSEITTLLRILRKVDHTLK